MKSIGSTIALSCGTIGDVVRLRAKS